MSKKWLALGAVIVGLLVVAGVMVFDRGGFDPSSFTVLRDGCPHSVRSSSAVDWAPFVRIEGRTYYEQIIRSDEPQLTAQSLDATAGTVRCMLGDEVQIPPIRPATAMQPISLRAPSSGQYTALIPGFA